MISERLSFVAVVVVAAADVVSITRHTLTFHMASVPQNTLWEMEYYTTNVKEFKLKSEGKENCSDN